MPMVKHAISLTWMLLPSSCRKKLLLLSTQPRVNHHAAFFGSFCLSRSTTHCLLSAFPVPPPAPFVSPSSGAPQPETPVAHASSSANAVFLSFMSPTSLLLGTLKA